MTDRRLLPRLPTKYAKVVLCLPCILPRNPLPQGLSDNRLDFNQTQIVPVSQLADEAGNFTILRSVEWPIVKVVTVRVMRVRQYNSSLNEVVAGMDRELLHAATGWTPACSSRSPRTLRGKPPAEAGAVCVASPFEPASTPGRLSAGIGSGAPCLIYFTQFQQNT